MYLLKCVEAVELFIYLETQQPKRKSLRMTFAQASYNQKDQSLANLYRPPMNIMFCGTFSEVYLSYQTVIFISSYYGFNEKVMDKALDADKWLLINLQQDSEFLSHILNR